MQSETKIKISDITFIGSGISSSFTILHFLDLLESNKETTKLNISIIDKYKEFHTGIPYGARSGFSVHLITSLKNFLPEPELSKFILWLNQNKKWLIDRLKTDGGLLSQDWISTHKEKIENNEWEDLFIPRRFFGEYIDQKVKNRLQELQKKQLIAVEYIVGEVVDLERINDQYKLCLKNGETIRSEKVVLSVGSLPVNHLWKQEKIIEEESLLFVNEPYEPELSEVLSRINTFLTKQSSKKINALIVGANASGLEMLYKLNDIDDIKKNINKFTFLSTQGLLPDAVIDKERKKEYVPFNLQSLKEKNDLTAKSIADATFKDLDQAEEINLGAASTVEIISKSFGALLGKLNREELKKFACVYGNEIGRRQRCAGFHYSKTVEELKNEKHFDHIAGRFESIFKNDANLYQLEYLDTASGQKKIYDDVIHLVINCVGSTNLTQKDIPQLLQNMIAKGYCKPNDSKIGFEVNESLESFENLHITGPLVAGNIFEGKAVWHLEHCGRIIWLSHVLSKKMNDYFINNNKLNKHPL